MMVHILSYWIFRVSALLQPGCKNAGLNITEEIRKRASIW